MFPEGPRAAYHHLTDIVLNVLWFVGEAVD